MPSRGERWVIVLVVLFAVWRVEGQTLIPAECYLDQQGGEINICKYCHTSNFDGAGNDDIDRQGVFPSPDNRFLNMLEPERLDALVSKDGPDDWSIFLAEDNYGQALKERGDVPGLGMGQGRYKYFPDLDPARTGEGGFANDGWRAFKWKPTQFGWPKDSGRIQQNWVRMADEFRRDEAGEYDRGIYERNLELLVQALRGEATRETYYGLAADELVVAHQFPVGTEVTHYLYYLDPEQPGMKATRVKEVRWMGKSVPRESDIGRFGMALGKEKTFSLAYREGDPDAAAEFGIIYNNDGWDIACFIEDVDGGLRPQNRAELTQCIGCHSRRIGAIRDSHWESLQRKLPGEAGWVLQDYQGIFDYYNAQLDRAEMAEFFENAHGDASLLPGNPDGSIDFLPDRERGMALNRRYYQIVRTQSFVLGRDPVLENPGFLRDPSTERFLPKDEQEEWNPELDLEAFDLVPVATAVRGEAEVAIPSTLILASNFPNPFNASTLIRFHLAAAGPVRLTVVDAAGRQVRLLEDGVRPAGSHDIRWGGRDEVGRRVASGAYFARLEQGEQRQTEKLLLLR